MRVTHHFPRFVSVLCKFETSTKSSPLPSNHISQNRRLFTEDFHHRKQGLSPQNPLNILHERKADSFMENCVTQGSSSRSQEITSFAFFRSFAARHTVAKHPYMPLTVVTSAGLQDFRQISRCKCRVWMNAFDGGEIAEELYVWSFGHCAEYSSIISTPCCGVGTLPHGRRYLRRRLFAHKG